MADAPDADQKTEAPSPKRRRESAERGEVLQSRELGTAAVLWAGIAWLIAVAGGLAAACLAMLRDGLMLAGPLHDFDGGQALLATARPLGLPLLVFAGLATLGMVAAPLALARQWSPAALAPKWSRIDPLAGLKRMFGPQIAFEVGKAALKAVLLFGIGGTVLAAQLPVLLTLAGGSPDMAAQRIGASLAALLTALGGGLIVIAAIDFPVQLQRHLGRLRMSKQEVRDEAKETEGSPETKAAQRQAARAAARRALAPAMAEASVVVVNPAEFAVALRYQPGRDAAPVVVALGRDVIAAAIRDLATEGKVPVLRYPQLTRAIFFTTQVGQPIRDDLYAAVAAVLAFVFSLEALAERAPPEIEVPAALRFNTDGRPA